MKEYLIALAFEKEKKSRGPDLRDAIWEDWKVFYVMAERKYRAMATTTVNAPNHQCERGECTLDRLDVRVLRYRDAFVVGAQNLHICFVASCEHLRPQHQCNGDQGAGTLATVKSSRSRSGGDSGGDASWCPHMRPVPADDTRVLKHFWVCRTTGLAHICGTYCTRPPLDDLRTGSAVCPLTNTVTESRLCNLRPDARESQLTMFSHYDDNRGTAAQLYLESGGTGGAGLRTRAMAGNVAAPPWEREGDLAVYAEVAEKLCNIMLFSAARQRVELDDVFATYRRADSDTRKLLRRRPRNVSRTPMNVSELAILDSAAAAAAAGADAAGVIRPHRRVVVLPLYLTPVHGLYPRNRYFHYVPIRADLLAVARAGVDECGELAKRHHVPHRTGVPASRCPHCRINALRERADRVIMRNLHTPAGAECAWESDKWQTFMERTKRIAAALVVTAWATLYKHSVEWVEGMPDSFPFSRAVLPLLYMLAEGYAVPVAHATGVAADRVPLVTVLPRMSIMELLPPVRMLESLGVPERWMPSVRSIDRMSASIKDIYATQMAQQGDVFAARLGIEDVLEETGFD